MDSLNNFLQGELERLFELEAMKRLSSELLGIDPNDTNLASSKGAFARWLVKHCEEGDALQALGDAILLSSKDANPSLRDLASYNGHNSELQPGTKVGELRVVKKIGQGGIGTVYLAELQDKKTEKLSKVALKVFHASLSHDQSAINRYKTASRVLQSIHAPQLAATLDVGQLEDSRPWVAAEHLPGQTLALRIKNIGSIHFNEAKPLFCDILESLKAIHERGLIHGNLKPENVFLIHTTTNEDSGSKLRAVLVDGCVNRLILPSKSTTSHSGLFSILATAKTIAPEQARGIDFDIRSDIYAMGVLMYEVISGRPPFEADNAADLIAKHLSVTPDRPSTYARRGWVFNDIDDLIMKALAKDPSDRYQNVDELLNALNQIGKPAKKVSYLDQEAFQKATDNLLANPSNEDYANTIEQQVRESEEWLIAITAFEQAAEKADDGIVKLKIMLRIARILETGAKDYSLARQAYEKVIELDPDNEASLEGIESCIRLQNDTESLLELLLDKVENELDSNKKVEILKEIAEIYEQEQGDEENAFVAWLQALIENPSDELLAKEVERLAGSSEEMWNEALETLSATGQSLYAKVFPEQSFEDDVQEVDLQDVHIQEDDSQNARIAAEQELEAEIKNLSRIEEEYTEASQRAEELTTLADEHADHAKEAHDKAEISVDAYESATQASNGQEATEEEKGEAIRLGEEAERMVTAADEADERAQEMANEASLAWDKVHELDAVLTEAREKVGLAQEKLDSSQIEEEQRRQELVHAEPFDSLEIADADGIGQEQDRSDLLQISLLMGKWYASKLGKTEFALSCYDQALSLESDNKRALDGISEVYRNSQAWNNLVDLLLNRADNSPNPIDVRDFRAEAALIMTQKLDDEQSAFKQYQIILEQDPAHKRASETVEAILLERNDWPALVELLQNRIEFLEDAEKIETLNDIAELYADRLNKINVAIEKYKEALKIDPLNITALKGLENIYAQEGNIESLLQNLKTQTEIASTPKQTILLLERIGAIQEEEFVDYSASAASFEKIIDIDPANDTANTALARLYRHLERYEDMISTLDKHARSTESPQRKIDLYLQAARTLMIDINEPDRAVVVCERILSINQEQTEALDLLARLKSSTGDVPAAIEALERLADKEEDTKKKADFYTRAAKLLEDSGDTDGAIVHYKNALDADNGAVEAADALHLIYAKNGDYHSTMQMLRKEISIAKGDLRKAELLAELGLIFSKNLLDKEQAYTVFQDALELDPTCTQAAIGLGEIAYENGEYKDATTYFESVFSHIDKLPAPEASKLCITTGESFLKVGDTEKARDAFKRARELARDDLEINEQLASLLMELGDFNEAERVYDRIIRKVGDELQEEDKIRLLLSLSTAQLRTNHSNKAVDTCKTAYELSPDSPEVLAALSQAYEANSEWDELISVLQLRTRLAAGDEDAFELYVQIGDVFLEKLHDRVTAIQTYTAALEINPQNRNLLTKLMAVYSDTQDWPRLIEVILRIAEMVDDPKQLAKYHRTVATIAHHELGRYEEAANYYEESLLNEPESETALTGLVECLTQNQDWTRLVLAYEKRIEHLSGKASTQEIAQLLDTCAEIMHHRLGHIEDAAQIYEQSQELDPDNHNRREKLNEIYTSEPKRFFTQSIQINREMLATDPRRVESYKAMRKTFTKVKKPDESWCACQVLHYLDVEDADEQKFFRKYRLKQIPKLKRAITEEMWRELIIHPLQTNELTSVFTALSPAIVVSQSQALSTFGISPEYKTDPANDPSVIARMLDYVSISTQLPLPDVYHRVDDTGGLSFIFSSPPAIGIGEGARAGGPQQALAFVAARHLSYFRLGHFIRQLVPTGTGLRAWLTAAIRMIAPKFPASAILESQIADCRSAIERHLSGPHRDTLRGISHKLLEASPELDMKIWINGVDLTADRIGFILSNDLKLSNAVIEASPDDSSSVPKKDRIDMLLQYSVSDQYFELRHQLGIALGK